MFFLSSDRQVKRAAVAAAMTFSFALAAHATSLISLEITSNDYAPETPAAGLFADDPGDPNDVDIDFTASTIVPMTFNEVGDSFTFNYGQLNLASGKFVVPGVDAAGSGQASLPAAMTATVGTTLNAERFDGQSLQNFQLTKGDAFVSFGESIDLGGGDEFLIFGLADFGPQFASVTYTFGNGVQAEILFEFEQAGNSVANIGNGLDANPTTSNIQMTATLTDYMIPEPSTYALFGISLGVLAFFRRRRKA